MLLLFWPYPDASSECRGAWLHGVVERQLQSCRGGAGHQLLHNEVRQLRQQFRSVLGYVNKCNCHCSKNAAA